MTDMANEIERLRAALATAEARVTASDAMVAHLRQVIARMRQDRFGASSERGKRLLAQLELELEDLEATLAEDAPIEPVDRDKPSSDRPARRPFPAELPRERVVLDTPAHCPCCGSARLSKLGESVTETLELVPRRFKVIQTVREKLACRDCETIHIYWRRS